jgi:hypothetical protein
MANKGLQNFAMTMKKLSILKNSKLKTTRCFENLRHTNIFTRRESFS